MPEANKPISSAAGETADAQQRRRRRGSRGGRGRSGRRRPGPVGEPSLSSPPPPDVEASAAEIFSETPEPSVGPADDSVIEPVIEVHETPAGIHVDEPSPHEEPVPRRTLEPVRPRVVERHSEQAVREPRKPRPSAPPSVPQKQLSAVGEAIEDVYRIIEALKKVMEDLDEVLETLEFAERQKIEDERELDSLRRALRQVQRPSREDRSAPPAR